MIASSFSVMSFAQPDTDLNTGNDTSSRQLTAVQQDRIAKLEKQVEELKASHEELNKQLADLKSRVPVVKKKKLVASRVGSKQGVWVEE